MRRYLPILLLFLAGCVLQPTTEPRRPDPASEPTMVPTAIAIEKPTYVVERGPVTAQLVNSGRVTPINQNQLSFAIDGQISTLLVAEGDLVTAGDPVATLDTTTLEQAKQEAEANLSLAQQQLALAQAAKAADRRRAEIDVELVQLQLDFAVAEAGSAPTAEQTLAIEVLQLQLELAQLNLAEFDDAVDPAITNQVTQAQLQLERVLTQIGQSTLVTPLTGTVVTASAAPGNNIIAGETVLVIADLTQVEVQLSLLDREMQQLTEGLTAIGTLPTQPDTTFNMTIRQLPYPFGSGGQDDDADGFVHLAFDDPAQTAELRIGERIEATILLARHDNVLWLPPAAIREFNGRLFVVVQEGQSQKRLDIQIGLQNENQIEIISGVAEGQLVVGP